MTEDEESTDAAEPDPSDPGGDDRPADEGTPDGGGTLGEDLAEDEEEEDSSEDDTVPRVELELYQASVRVSGRSTDDLHTVQGAARELMDYLIDRARDLEDSPDDRGLG